MDALGPLVLLLVHADMDRKRLRLRRHVAVSAAAAGLALSLLVLVAVTSILVMLQGDDWADGEVWIALASWPTAWVVWTVVLWRMGERLLDPATAIQAQAYHSAEYAFGSLDIAPVSSIDRMSAMTAGLSVATART